MTNNYRYTLRRSWMGSGGVINWVMLNPSTADDLFDDPTIRKCCGFAKAWGYSGIIVTNLFAYRATDPKEMKAVARRDYGLAVGEDNRAALIAAAGAADLVVAAWGIHGNFLLRADEVLKAELSDVDLHVIGLTKDGLPLHPCMAAYTPAPIRWKYGDGVPF